MARPLDRYDNILLPFSTNMWLAVLVTACLFAMSLYATHFAYNMEPLHTEGFHRKERSKFNFVLYTFSRLTEPDPLPWFTHKWSAGKFLAILWAIFGLFLVLCYNSNFRAHLTARTFEKSLDTIEDVVDNDKVSWFPRDIGVIQAKHLEATGQTGTPFYQIAKQAETSGTLFEGTNEGGVSARAIQVTWEDFSMRKSIIL